MKLTRRTALITAAVAAVTAGSLAGVWIGIDGARPSATAGSAAKGTVVAESDDVLPSVTGTDWVTYADQVVVVRPTAEREIPASEEETEAGEGYVGRAATLTVDQVLWSRTAAPAAPDTVDVDVAGWVFKDGERREFAIHDSPRLEKGHT
ncbi:hypothetical protein ACFVTQ_13665, partial [Streptomyces cyaneofuscatus]